MPHAGCIDGKGRTMQYARDFRTHSLYVAATLIACGVPYWGLQDQPGGRAQFQFDNDQNMAHLILQGYMARNLDPAPQPAAVVDALFQLRDEIRRLAGR